MNLAILEHAIRSMCIEVDAASPRPPDWFSLSEEDLMFELLVCVFSSQEVFELAVSAAENLCSEGIISQLLANEIEAADLQFCLSKPFKIEVNGLVRERRLRFSKRNSQCVIKTVEHLRKQRLSLGTLLLSGESPEQVRRLLIKNVSGFGPKQASLFLRRIGYSADLAVFDVHVLSYLSSVDDVFFPPSKLSNLSFYETLERRFAELAKAFGVAVGTLDLATWITVRVAKREGLQWA